MSGKVVVVFGRNGDIGGAVFDAVFERGWFACGFTRSGADVTSTDSIRSALGTVWATHGRIDGVVCCHGAPGVIKPSTVVTDSEFWNVLEIDVLGSFKVAREAMRYMGPQERGSIVFVSSIHAVATYPQRAAYAAAKAGVCGLMRALAVEWVHRGVRVNAVLPGQVQGTKRTERHENEDAYKRSPSGEFVTPEAVAAAACYLLDAPGVNGHALVVDDGWTASAWYGDHGAQD